MQGEATVTLGDRNFQLSVNQFIYIPIKEIHALANDGEVKMQIIEVQCGDYLGEDDIVRLEDKYGRV